MVQRRREPDGSPIVLGGSLTRDAQGRLYTFQTTPGVRLSPKVVQDLWATVSRIRFPAAWDGLFSPYAKQAVYWAESTTTVECGRCHKALGRCRAYEANGEFGVVSDTSTEYVSRETQAAGERALFAYQRIAPKEPRFELAGSIVDSSRTTQAVFRCHHCNRRYTRNLNRLGKGLYTTVRSVMTLDEGAHQ